MLGVLARMGAPVRVDGPRGNVCGARAARDRTLVAPSAVRARVARMVARVRVGRADSRSRAATADARPGFSHLERVGRRLAPSAWTQSLRYAVAVDWTAAHGFERAPDRRGRGQALSRDAATQVVVRLASSRAVAKALARDGRGGAGEDGGAVRGNGVYGVGAGSSKDATCRRRAKEGGAAYREADAMRPGPLPHVFARGVPGELFVLGGDAGDAEELVEIHRVVDFS